MQRRVFKSEKITRSSGWIRMNQYKLSEFPQTCCNYHICFYTLVYCKILSQIREEDRRCGPLSRLSLMLAGLFACTLLCACMSSTCLIFTCACLETVRGITSLLPSFRCDQPSVSFLFEKTDTLTK